MVALPLLCGGCSLPLQWTILSTAADGASYASTSKTTSDHALSSATECDCSLMRIFEEEPVCRDVLPAMMAEPAVSGLPGPKPAIVAAAAAVQPDS
ncbi:MAG: hypothetical protein EXQ97_02215 [Alphaproteobacteria bacterium]|nr:hypothetical protein [Alphaproteobacteria bacterium]